MFCMGTCTPLIETSKLDNTTLLEVPNAVILYLLFLPVFGYTMKQSKLLQ